MSTPAFNVVLKAFNEEGWIGSAIESVLAQTLEDFELVVVDDGSTDGTAEVVRGFQSDSRVRLISQENKGVGGAVNAGIEAGSAPYISLIDADDFWMPTYLEQMGRALDEDPQAGFAYTDAWVLQLPEQRFRRKTTSDGSGEPDPVPRDPEEFLQALIYINFVLGLATMRRSAVEAVGGFNQSLRGAEEWEMWIRLLAAGHGVVRVPAVLAIVRDREDSLHTDARMMITNIREVWRIAMEDLDTSDEVKSIARRRMAWADRQIAARDGEARVTAAWHKVRRPLGALRRALLARRYWYPGIPPGVAEAFPELAQRVGG